MGPTRWADWSDLLTPYGVSLLLFAGYWVWQGGFPEFSELGRI